jgi:hypothetical protein
VAVIRRVMDVIGEVETRITDLLGSLSQGASEVNTAAPTSVAELQYDLIDNWLKQAQDMLRTNHTTLGFATRLLRENTIESLPRSPSL